MTTTRLTRILGLTLVLTPGAAVLPIAMSQRARGLAPGEAAAQHARFDPSLGAMRAGRVDAPAPLGSLERAQLGAAQERSTALAALRGGFEPTNNQWTWLAIGAGIVLLIVLI